MIYRHIYTGVLYRVLLKSFDTSRQEHHVVYMQMETGRIFNRNCSDFEDKFELLNDRVQEDISPEVDF